MGLHETLFGGSPSRAAGGWVRPSSKSKSKTSQQKYYNSGCRGEAYAYGDTIYEEDEEGGQPPAYEHYGSQPQGLHNQQPNQAQYDHQQQHQASQGLSHSENHTSHSQQPKQILGCSASHSNHGGRHSQQSSQVVGRPTSHSSQHAQHGGSRGSSGHAHSAHGSSSSHHHHRGPSHTYSLRPAEPSVATPVYGVMPFASGRGHSSSHHGHSTSSHGHPFQQSHLQMNCHHQQQPVYPRPNFMIDSHTHGRMNNGWRHGDGIPRDEHRRPFLDE